ncbi:hypothetical protein LWI29_021013 [Acer saccharum]|uniref:C-JID domain-containing protein n=1 Tax=Acer saccharum TaxID=4024 RepID=A0AA39RQX8_ACESA|nr:hypothetical protein LWI29_021013 [Acer saccharum]
MPEQGLDSIMQGMPEQGISGKSFTTMKNLRLLKISNVRFSDDHLEYLSNELRLLKWRGYPLKTLPSSFQPKNLFKLDMCYSHVEFLWDDKKHLEKLKTIKLSYSCNLIATPDFTNIPNLERLELKGCTKLCRIHPSIGSLKRLTIFRLNNCNLSEGIIPNDLGSLISLEELDLSGNNFVSVPESISELPKLSRLCLNGCHRLRWLPKIPPDIHFLLAEDCTSLETISSAKKKSTSSRNMLYFLNCCKLTENQGTKDNLAVTLLKQRLQDLSHHSYQFDICLPGTKIPEWFSHCNNIGSSVGIGLRDNWLNDDFIGFAVCIVFDHNWGYGRRIECSIWSQASRTDFSFRIPTFTTAKSDHLWLGNLSREILKELLVDKCVHAHFEIYGGSDMFPHYSVKREPGKWSRLWRVKEVSYVLTENKGTEAIEAIILNMPEQELDSIMHGMPEQGISGKSFITMKNLRLLKISNVRFSDDHLEYLSNELWLLKWRGYPLKTLPSSFQPKNLFKLDMCYSHVEFLWGDKKHLEKLKTIKLSYSCNLIETPDFTNIPNLERLELKRCTKLRRIHPSIGSLKRLTIFRLNNCNLSEGIIPNDLGSLISLEELDLSGNNFVSLPESISELPKLSHLCLNGCRRLRWLPKLPPNINILLAEDCSSLGKISSAKKQSTSSRSTLDFITCCNLTKNQGTKDHLAVTLLKQRLQDLSHNSNRFDICLSGNRIPKWFSHCNFRSSIGIELRDNWLNDDFMGFAVCAVFDDNWDYKRIECSIWSQASSTDFHFPIPTFTTAKSSHLWIAYLSREILKELPVDKCVHAHFGISVNSFMFQNRSVKRSLHSSRRSWLVEFPTLEPAVELLYGIRLAEFLAVEPMARLADFLAMEIIYGARLAEFSVIEPALDLLPTLEPLK